jgi:integrase/recombinase XerD
MQIGKYQQKLFEYMKYKRYAKNSIDNYVSYIGRFLSHFEKQATKPSEISSNCIKNFLTTFNDANTHKAYLCAIKLFYSKIGNQPHKLDKIEYPKLSKKLPIVLSQEEIQKLFDNTHNLKHKTIIALLYSCGLRVSELINLKWQHIDRSRMIINIISGKGNKDRQVPLPVPLMHLFEKYFREYRSKEYVFNGQFSLKYSATSVLNIVKNAASDAKINKHVYTHLIRHCSFTHMVESGIDINIIQNIAGHSNAKTTMIYCHLSHNLISKIKSPIENINL